MPAYNPFDATKLSTAQRINLIRIASQKLAQNPRDPDMLLQSGILHAAENRYNEAIDLFKRALAIKKKDRTVLQNLADSCSANGRYIEAKKYARKMLELEPRNRKYLVFTGEMLEKMGNADQALAIWQKLNRFYPNEPKHMQQLAACYRLLGMMDEANALYAEIQEIDPGHAETLYLFANSRKFSPDEVDKTIETIDQAIKKTDNDIDHANLLYSSGKVYLDTKRYDEAFERYIRANKQRQPEERENPYAPFENNKHAFDKPFFTARKDFGLETDQPIFVLGMPRSGTTLVESICGAHSKITAGDELSYMEMLAKPMGINSADKTAYRDQLMQMSKERSISKAQQYLESTKVVAGNTPYFTDKLPHNFLRMGLISVLFPNAKIIHCRRHPIDNCVSLFTNSMGSYHNAYKTDLTSLGLYYRQYVQLMDHWRKVLPNPFHEVFYEDVVANTELNARGMINYLGLDWEDKVMDRQGSQKSVKTLSVWQVRQPVYTSSAGRWKVFEKHLGPLIDALGPVVGEYEAELAALSESTGE